MFDLGHFSKKDVAVLKLKLKYSTISVKAFGNSMYPIIQNKDTLIIKNISEILKTGDIVLYTIEINGAPILVTHRIIKIDRHLLLLKGDNNDKYDPIVRMKNIIGLVEKVIR